MEIKFQVQTKIQKPIAEVFDAVYKPGKIERHILQTAGQRERSTKAQPVSNGRLPTHRARKSDFPLRSSRRSRTSLSSSKGQSGPTAEISTVEMKFEQDGPTLTIVRFRKSGWDETPTNLKRSYGTAWAGHK